MGRANISRHLQVLFVLICIICLFPALTLPPNEDSLADSAGAWTAAGSLITARSGHTATLLAGGKVLVAGGKDLDGIATSDCEIYDPSTGIWTGTGSLATGRFSHTAALLTSGRVLVAGGTDGADAFSDCEIYDPSSETWTGTANLAMGRFSHTATLLPGGQVLAAGGNDLGVGGLSSCEIYDPTTETWTEAASLGTARWHHTATLLPGGRVLVAGGQNLYDNALSDCRIYDPSTGVWTAVGSLATARSGHTATVLPGGQVLAAGGQGLYGNALSDCEIYNPSTRVWEEAASLVRGRFSHTATLLPGGQVLAAGGNRTYLNGKRTVLSSCEVLGSPSASPNKPVTEAAASRAPGAPRNVTATAGNAQATVSFSPPTSSGGSAITGYTVTSTPGSITAQGSASPITVTGLTNGTAYTFTVTATNAIGTGPASSPSNLVTPATVPGAPASVTATAGNAQAMLSFTPPASNGGSDMTGYTVTSSPGGITAQGSESPITVSGLANGTAYTFTVATANAVGTGPPSAPSNRVTPGAAAGARSKVTAKARKPAVTGRLSDSSNQATATGGSWLYARPITITNSGSALSNYQINIALTSANMTFANANSNGSDVRIKASDGVTDIPYWIEQWNSANQIGSIWANVPSIPSGTSTIYLVYGNPSGSTTTSGTNTFLFFDDFETADPTTQPGYYQESTPATVNMGAAQVWEGTDWPHFFTVLTMNAAIDGTAYKYWGWYGLHSDTTSGIGLAGSNDLVN